MKRLPYVFFTVLLLTFVMPNTVYASQEPTGKIVFHSYSDYYTGDSRIYLYDFKTGTLKCLSSGWNNVINPMNACFRNDGKAITFMGETEDGEWDIFEYVFGEKDPVNLTEGNGLDDEDPKYDPRGQSIVFKQSNPSGTGTRIVRYDTKTSKLSTLISGLDEKSMPYYSPDGKKLYYVVGEDDDSSINVADLTRKKSKLLYKAEGTQSYYPIVSNDGRYLFFSKGFGKDNNADQIIRYNTETGKADSLKCNSEDFDCSDTCCVSDTTIIISSSKPGGRGGYDLYLVDIYTGSMTSLSEFNARINTSLEELGCDYY